MTQPKASQRGAVKRKRYSSVPEMVRDLSEDIAFGEAVARKIEERTIINHLMAMRTLQGLSQQDIAAKMGCTQSRVSKLEGGKDNDLRIGDFHAYAEALGLKLIILMASKEQPSLVERIKYHAAALRRLFTELSKFVGNDDAMQRGAMRLFAEAVCNLAKGIVGLAKDFAQQLPRAKGGPSPIQVEMQPDEPDVEPGDACEREGCELPVPG